MFVIKVDREKCKSCSLCVDICPNHVFKVSMGFNKMGYHYIEADNQQVCNGCKRCVLVCPDVAIEIYKTDEEKT